ncbi:hypothetical protein AUJ46_06190 [Candidatus Peregrinibacteria bacterium CG1_02_54_53]|nr:MAG: hypothetical protein AUJ46_06190 [Candidatus Peregrinibacteria bacterium CG1_02_54_53]
MADLSLSILFVDQYGHMGGGQRILVDLVIAAKARGWRVHVLCPSGPLVDVARNGGADVHILALPVMRDGPKSLISLVRMSVASRHLARKYASLAQSCDLIVVNGPRTLAIARTWVRRFKKPALLYLHKQYGRIENALIRFFLSLPHTAAVAVSALVAKPFDDLANVRHISNWVAAEFLDAPASLQRLRQVLGIKDSNPIVLVPGRFSPNKGQRLALEASRLLADVSCHFVFSGAPLFEEQGREVAKELAAQAAQQPSRIHVTDWQEGMSALYDGADVVLVPSVWEEPFGLTAIEAMARARPLIVTDRGTLSELTDDGRFAQVVPADSRAIAASLRTFFADRSAWNNRARQSRNHVEKNFHPHTLQPEVLALCESLLQS